MARVIAICNQKGGVGKTTTAVNLGAYLAALGKRTLLVDFDPQANASSALGYDPRHTEVSVYHGIAGSVHPDQVVKTSILTNLHVVPSAPHLAGAMIELVGVDEREQYLRKFVNQLRHRYEYVLIDLPPSLSLLTINGLVASDEILIPVQAEYYSLEGIGQILETVNLLKKNLNHELTINGALITMFDKREHLSREVARDLRRNFPHPVYETEIPRSVALAEAPSFSKPVLLYRPDSVGALAYERLAREIIKQEEVFRSKGEAVSSRDFGNFNVNVG